MPTLLARPLRYESYVSVLLWTDQEQVSLLLRLYSWHTSWVGHGTFTHRCSRSCRKLSSSSSCGCCCRSLSSAALPPSPAAATRDSSRNSSRAISCAYANKTIHPFTPNCSNMACRYFNPSENSGKRQGFLSRQQKGQPKQIRKHVTAPIQYYTSVHENNALISFMPIWCKWVGGNAQNWLTGQALLSPRRWQHADICATASRSQIFKVSLSISITCAFSRASSALRTAMSARSATNCCACSAICIARSSASSFSLCTDSLIVSS